MRNLILSLSLATTAFVGTAMAQNSPVPAPGTPPAVRPMPPHGGPMKMDADKDGVITRAEMLAQADARFTAEDTDRDGKVTVEERQAARDRMRAAAGKPERVPPPGGERGNGIGKRTDPNRDGVITRAEAQARAAERFDRIDANKDGRIDATERANMRAMWRAHRGMGHGPTPPQPGAPTTPPAGQ